MGWIFSCALGRQSCPFATTKAVDGPKANVSFSSVRSAHFSLRNIDTSVPDRFSSEPHRTFTLLRINVFKTPPFRPTYDVCVSLRHVFLRAATLDSFDKKCVLATRLSA